MKRPWFARAILLLVTLVTLQAGAFRGLDGGAEWFELPADVTAAFLPAVAPETGDTADADEALFAHRYASPATIESAPPALRLTVSHRIARGVLPEPTGPPRA